MKCKTFLKTQLFKEFSFNFGIQDEKFIDHVVNVYMDDKNDNSYRGYQIKKLKDFVSNPRKILDMASGCGTTVFYGLNKGYDMYGIEPSDWKNDFINIKLDELNYPEEYKNRFIKGFGENLPFEDNFFDGVLSYETLEHVQSVEKCIKEMIRVTKPSGGIYIICPDYIGTYEPHYQLPWVPFFPKKIAKVYLRMINRPIEGIDTIGYVTQSKILSVLSQIEKANPNLKLEIIDIHYNNYMNRINACKKSKILFLKHKIRKYIRYFRVLFKEETSAQLFIKILEK